MSSQFTDDQLATLKAAINNETDPTFVGYRQAGSTGLMAEWFKLASTFVVWRTITPFADICDAINWKNFTPVDAPDTTQLWLNRAMACQSFQFNVQNMLLAAQVAAGVSSTKPSVRQGWQDSTSAIPSGAGGAAQSAGWTQIRIAMQRPAKRGEKVFATGTGTQANPGNLVFEGAITDADVVAAVNLP